MSKYYYDFHVHSCLSPCADDDMTPNNIAGMSAIKGLNILALTDHNSCKNCPAFFSACKRNGIIPIAGMELTTSEDIHIVCLFPSLDLAMEFDREIEKHIVPIKNRSEIFGNQLILDENDEILGEEENLLISSTNLDVLNAVSFARKFGAHVHPAHIDRDSNGIIAVLGNIPDEYGFNFFELNDKNNLTEITAKRNAVNEKNVLFCSDAHHLWDINEADNYIEIDDEPYSSALVRENLFKFLDKL